MAKATTSFRAAPDVMDKLAELGDLFKENNTEVIERAVNYLFKHREEAAKEDLEERLLKINKKI